jgi:hypothetical protein
VAGLSYLPLVIAGRSRISCHVVLADPRQYFPWLLKFTELPSTVSLRFIDPYGDAVFNQLQLPVLLGELETIHSNLNETRLLKMKKQYIHGSQRPPWLSEEEASSRASNISTLSLQSYLLELISLIQSAIKSGPHHYIRFLGD